MLLFLVNIFPESDFMIENRCLEYCFLFDISVESLVRFSCRHLSIIYYCAAYTVDVIKRYSNFVGAPIYLNGKKVNTLEVRDDSVEQS